ncbi:DUF551 domain-containing protein [Pseudomonas sp. IT-P12]|uniref:hypothetical protein n=1 Tax=Pseudomonas sp. IT-P12 TaxID=3026450 RepID=UPI0039E1668B
MTDYTELKRLAEAVNQTYADLCEHGGDELAEAWDSAELAYDDAANPRVVLALIAENEALRDDLEQAKYDADAWRNQEESLWVEVYRSEGDDPFISAVQGSICIEELTKIQDVFLQYPEEYFEHGSGLYVFRCDHHQAHYDNVGMTEPAHWEIEFESHGRFSWVDEQEAAGEEVGNG